MKKVFAILFVLIIAAAAALTVSAADRPYWYPDPVINPFPDFHGENLPRVVDDADIFSDVEEAELTRRVNALIAKFDNKYDLVIFTDVSNYGVGAGEYYWEGIYPSDFYQFNGYGKGENYSGSVIFICMDPDDRYWWSSARGDSREYFTDKNINDLDDTIEPYMVDHEFYEAMLAYISRLDYIYEHGPKIYEASDFIGASFFAGIIGLIVGGIRSSKEVNKMKSVKYAVYANDYVIDNSFEMRDSKVSFLYSTVTKTYIPPSSSSGGSSHSGSYHSSGGGSFSGGGRHF